MPIYSCPLPAFFDDTTDSEGFVNQFNSVPSLADCENHTFGLSLQFLFTHFVGGSLRFHRSLTTTQSTNMNLFLNVFRSQSAPSQKALKATVTALRQQPGQTIPTFYGELQGLARKSVRSAIKSY